MAKKKERRKETILAPKGLTETGLEYGWWYVLNQLGEGDAWEGRRRMLNVGPDLDEVMATVAPWADEALAYSKKCFPKNNSFAELSAIYDSAAGALTGSMQLGMGISTSIFARVAWYDAGMTTVQLGHRLASALMLSKVPKDILDEVRLPYDSFSIEVPNDLLSVTSQGATDELRLITVTRFLIRDQEGGEPLTGVAFVAAGAKELCFWSIQENLAKLLSEDGEIIPIETGPMDVNFEKADDRIILLVKRLILGVCLYMTGEKPTEPVGKHHGPNSPAQRIRNPGPPTKRVFRLTQDVHSNLTEVVRSYVRGNSKRVTVQSQVAPHWKWQPYGPGRTQRKHIFVESYWRGPEDAPIALRKKVLDD